MRFGKKKQTRSNVALSTKVLFDDLLGDRYIRLADTPEVKIAVDKIADLVSNMTIHLLENGDKGDKRLVNELSRKIDIEPCKYMTRKQWVFKIVRDLLLYGEGNSLVHIKVDKETGLIDELKPLNMEEVTYQVNYYDYSVLYKNKEYTPDELLHFVINPHQEETWRGTGYKHSLRGLTDNLNQATKTKSSFMTGKYMPSLIVKVDAMSEELSSEKGRDKILEQYVENSDKGKPWVIPSELLEVEQIKPLSLNDIAINESVEIDKKTVARLLDVPPFLLGAGEFNKEEYNNFINTRIYSMGQVISQTLTRDLLVSPFLYFKMNPRSLYAYDLPELVTSYSAMLDRNAIDRNEFRSMVGFEAREDMEELIVLENYIPQDKLGDQNKLKGGENTEK